MILMLLMLALAFLIMVVGAELLVYGAARLASMFGVSQLVIGLTIVAIGTSAPELVVAIRGSITNHSDLVVGNCIGSNIFNLLFIIGAGAAIAPLRVSKQLIRLDIPIMIAGNFLFLLVGMSGKIDRSSALFLLACFALYYWFILHKSRQENALIDENDQDALYGEKSSCTSLAIMKQIGVATIGLILCIIGAEWVVNSSVKLAQILGVSELVIGLTIVAIGTSLPEAAISLVAILRGRRDIAIGNIIGSCIFNILAVVGVAGLINPKGIAVAPSVLRFDLPVLIVTSIACLPIFFTGYKISRWEGFLFLFYYAAYISYLILESHQHDLLPMFSAVMLWFVIPLTLVTLTVIVYRILCAKIRSVK